MKIKATILFVCLSLLSPASCESAFDDSSELMGGVSGTGQMSLEVDHSFDGGRSFLPRGTLNIHSLRSTSASFESVVTVTDSHLKALENLCSVSHKR
jgi:hypothetical protein